MSDTAKQDVVVNATGVSAQTVVAEAAPTETPTAKQPHEMTLEEYLESKSATTDEDREKAKAEWESAKSKQAESVKAAQAPKIEDEKDKEVAPEITNDPKPEADKPVENPPTENKPEATPGKPCDDDTEEEEEDDVEAEQFGGPAMRFAIMATAGDIKAFDPSQPRDRSGRFAGGSRLSDAGANASAESAYAASKAARSGTGSHATAAALHRDAERVQRKIAERSKAEFDKALERRDMLGAKAHYAEATKARANAEQHLAEATEHEKATDESEEAFRERVKSEGLKRPGILSRGAKATARGLWSATKGIGKGTWWATKKTATGTWAAAKWAAGKSKSSTEAASAAPSTKPANTDVEAAEFEYKPQTTALSRRRVAASEGESAMRLAILATAEKLRNNKDIIATSSDGPWASIVATSDAVDITAAETDGERVPRFAIRPAYCGGPLSVNGYPVPVIVDLSGLTVNEQAVTATLRHDDSRLIGHVDVVDNNKSVLALEGVCSGMDSDVDGFLKSKKRKFPWHASIEARPKQKPELIQAGAKVRVNGQEFEGPVYVSRKTELYGVSFVPRGADSKTNVMIAAEAAPQPPNPKESNMALPTFEEFLNDNYPKSVRDMLTDAQKAEIKEKFDKQLAELEKAMADEQPAEPKEPTMKAAEFDLDAIRASHDLKKDALDELYAKYETEEHLPKAKFSSIKAAAKSAMQTLRAKAIEDHMAKALYEAECDKIHAKAELEFVRESRPVGPAIHAARNNEEMNGDILAAAVLRTGKYKLQRREVDIEGNDKLTTIEATETLFTPEVLDASRKRFRHGIGLQEMIVAAAEMNGWTGRSFKQDRTECMRYAFGQHQNIHATSFSTVDMAGILSNLANKFLLKGFYFVENMWRQVASIRQVNDLKTTTAYRMTRGGQFNLVPPTGELKHGQIGEESFTNKADTYGEMLAITRTDIINDDLGAITTVPQTLGHDAGLAMNKIFWTKFLGQISTLFTQARLNKLSFAIDAASAALGIDSLTLAEQKFMDLKDPQGEPIGHMPAILLTGTGLSATAAKLFKDTDIRVPASSTKTADYTTGNPHAGKFRPVVSRYINNSSYTGYTNTGWGIIADPNELALMEMVFLDGKEDPTVEQADADFNTLGIQMRAYLDFGCNTQDYRAGVWSDGSTS